MFKAIMGQLLNYYELTGGTASCSKQVSDYFFFFLGMACYEITDEWDFLSDFIQNEFLFLTGLFSLLLFHRICCNYITQTIKEIPTNLSINTSVYKIAVE